MATLVALFWVLLEDQLHRAAPAHQTGRAARKVITETSSLNMAVRGPNGRNLQDVTLGEEQPFDNTWPAKQHRQHAQRQGKKRSWQECSQVQATQLQAYTGSLTANVSHRQTAAFLQHALHV